MFRTDHRREASAESETPKVEYCIYPGTRSRPPGGVGLGRGIIRFFIHFEGIINSID